jgi:threonine/homoserine/homoserine lactone efflux protein
VRGGGAVTEWLPFAIAIAASPFPVIPVIVLLFTARPRAASSSFLGGWAVGVLVPTAVAVALAEVVEQADHPPTWASWTRIVLGAALLVLGVRQWLTRHERDEAPAWMTSLESADPRRAARTAFLLSAINPKVLLLAIAGGLAIGTMAYGWFGDVVSVLSFTAVASVSVAVPVVMFLVAGERMHAPLETAKNWLEHNNAALMAVVITVIGIALLLKGFGGL